MEETRYTYRGLDIENLCWRYGAYYKFLKNTPYPCGNNHHLPKDYNYIILFHTYNDWGLPTSLYSADVLPDSIGICTNVKDNKGKYIYEGDIVVTEVGTFTIKYCDKCKSLQCFDEQHGCYKCLGDFSWQEFIDCKEKFIEGNIHENKRH